MTVHIRNAAKSVRRVARSGEMDQREAARLQRRARRATSSLDRRR